MHDQIKAKRLANTVYTLPTERLTICTRSKLAQAVSAETIAESLTYLINLQTGIIPKEWEQGKVTPVHKSGKRDNLNNYRPISVLQSYQRQ